MKKYFVALIAFVLALFSYNSFAQTNTKIASNDLIAQATSQVENRRLPSRVSATVKGSLYIKKGDEKNHFRITVYKLVNNRWVNVNNFSTVVKPNGEYLTVIRGEGTYRFVPSVRFNSQYKFKFTPANHTVRIKQGSNAQVFIRNFTYKRDNRK